MENCIFCKIINKEIPSEIIYENDKIIVFKDINPKADIHLLIVPKKHIENINVITEEDKNLLSEMILTAKKIAIDLKIDLNKSGYKLIFNVGRGAGQTVDHLHLHLLSGFYNRSLSDI